MGCLERWEFGNGSGEWGVGSGEWVFHYIALLTPVLRQHNI